MVFFIVIVWLIVGSSIFLWFIAMLFSFFTRGFVYKGTAEYSGRLIFQLTSKECLSIVKRGILSIVKSCHEVGFSNYEIWLVTDKQRPPICVDRQVKVIIVPNDFECKARYKARALEYARRRRVREHYNGWIYFIDEENWVTKQTINAINHFIAHGNAQIASGPLIFTRASSMLIWLGDSIRTAECRVCHFGHSFGRWPVHGENLLLHSEVEKEVGWEFESLLEDVMFSAYAAQKGYGTGWHGGQLFSTSPMSLLDFIKQRRRWFRGMLQHVLNRNVNAKYKVLELYLLSCGLLGIIFVAGVVVNLFYHFVSPSFSYFYLYPSLILLSTACFIGCNGNYWQRLLSALFCWVFVIVDSISAWFSLIKPPKRFDIIKKV